MMLNKRELSTVDIPARPDENTLPKKMPKGAYQAEVTYFCTAHTVLCADNHQQFLMVTMWKKNSPTALCRAFFDKTDLGFCTQLFCIPPKNYYQEKALMPLDKPIWSNSTLASLITGSASYTLDSHMVCANDGSVEIIQHYFKNSEVNPVAQIDQFQKGLRERQLNVKKANRRKAVDKVMSQVLDLPSDWLRFIDDYALLHSRYIIYERNKRKRVTGFCTHCKGVVELDKAKHNSIAKCPSCGSDVRLKSAGITHRLYDDSYADYIQPAENGAFFVRSFDLTRVFSKDFRSFEDHAWERRRYYFSPTEGWSMYDQWSGDWRRRNGVDFFSNFLYPHNVKSVLEQTKYKYSGADLMAAARERFSVVAYLEKYGQNPCLEYFPKLGLYRIAAEIAIESSSKCGVIDLKAKSPADVIPFSRTEIRRFAHQNMNLYELRVYADYKAAGYVLAENTLQEFRDHNAPADELLHNRASADPFKLFRYLRTQARSGYQFKTIFDLWKDYIQSAKAAGLDLSDEYYLFPKDVVEAHDALEVRHQSAKIKKKYYDLFLERAEEYRPFTYEDDDFLVRAPQSIEELVYNGMKMHICVGNPVHGYIQAHAERRKYLFFVRRKAAPDVPFVTFEMSLTGRFGQVSAYKNQEVSPKVRSFLKKWHKNVVVKLLRKEEVPERVCVAV